MHQVRGVPRDWEPTGSHETTHAATAETASLEVSGARDSAPAIAGANAASIVPQADAYVGMTRKKEHRRIESIDPRSWLARFGDVEATPLR